MSKKKSTAAVSQNSQSHGADVNRRDSASGRLVDSKVVPSSGQPHTIVRDAKTGSFTTVKSTERIRSNATKFASALERLAKK